MHKFRIGDIFKVIDIPNKKLNKGHDSHNTFTWNKFKIGDEFIINKVDRNRVGTNCWYYNHRRKENRLIVGIFILNKQFFKIITIKQKLDFLIKRK